MLFVFASIAGFVIETHPSMRTKKGAPDECLTKTNGTINTDGDVSNASSKPVNAFLYLLIMTMVFFTVEFFLRLITAPRPLAFIRSPLTIIDLLSILPFYVGMSKGLFIIKVDKSRKIYTETIPIVTQLREPPPPHCSPV